MGIKCPECQSDNLDDTLYCCKCAAPLYSSEEIPVIETFETPTEELTRGKTFASRYEIIELLGMGGMCKCYRVEDKKINEEIALKLIKPEIASDKTTIERFSNELKIARKIRHKNVCQMYDLGEEKGRHYITLEYVHGEDLKRLIRKVGSLSVGQVIPIAKQICEGLMEAHRLGVVHRDLKPQNIIVDEEGNARIMDFGIARSVEGKGITGEEVMIGTPEYMSPEQAELKEIDQRADIYSLGVILYEMVTGRVPFEGETPLSTVMKHKSEMPKNPRQFNAQLPEGLSHVILRCLEKNRENRYQSASDVRSELERVEKVLPIKGPAKIKKPLFKSLLSVLKERKIINTLAAFIGGGVASAEFAHHILVNHYHFPHQTVDIIIVTLSAAMLCTLFWLLFRGIRRPRKVKLEFILIPLVILVAFFLVVRLFKEMGREGEKTALGMTRENSIFKSADFSSTVINKS